MKLFTGVSILTFAAVLFALLFIGVRNPKPARWKAEAMVANVYAPLIIALGIFGAVFIVQWAANFSIGTLSWQEICLAATVVVAGVLVLKLLRIKKRLAQYAQAGAAGGGMVIPIHPSNEKPEPPEVDRRAA